MPQPLTHFKNVRVINLNAGDLVQHRPHLALHMIDVLSRFTFAEMQIGNTLLNILRGNLIDAEKHIEGFITTPNAAKQRRQLLAVATTMLDSERLEILDVLLAMLATEQKRRNKLVHWMSGYSPEIPDGILLLDPAHTWRMQVSQEKHRAEMRARTEYAINSNSWPPQIEDGSDRNDYKYIKVYKENDFDSMVADINQVERGFHLLGMLIGPVNPKRVARVTAQLCALRLFSQALSRKRRRQNAPPRNDFHESFIPPYL